MSKIIKFTGMTGAITTAITGALLVTLPAAPAYAQSGSRLCGWSAPLPNDGRIGLLFEAREKDASYTKTCNEAIDTIWNKIKADPQLKNFSWTRHEKEKCEDVGAKFVAGDMCDNMEAKVGYLVKTTKVEKTKDEQPSDGKKLTPEEKIARQFSRFPGFTTTYEKQDGSKSGISSILP